MYGQRVDKKNLLQKGPRNDWFHRQQFGSLTPFLAAAGAKNSFFASIRVFTVFFHVSNTRKGPSQLLFRCSNKHTYGDAASASLSALQALQVSSRASARAQARCIHGPQTIAALSFSRFDSLESRREPQPSVVTRRARREGRGRASALRGQATPAYLSVCASQQRQVVGRASAPDPAGT